ncbi:MULTISPECIES: NAD(P) transhydrogenase subunit alpha [Subtercola]|uniref:proton-translocating NAD(P)(+) transhydrogenase n=1 Tax=Subtercola vilae TaxID=2056433 RepID=A0A4T2C8W3_9MICO|nr:MULTISPECIES: NAD(P) transhydrogenase subunit alpha [Subtercola]MEA9983810.1 NAD(P) transhydrogenase subunit alpha [Subtercola sp. RTI3]TIH40650.1 NAD(P) transhydrogenase subunit alpha [Subtercola vilae]
MKKQITIGVVRETAAGERRVALDPETVARLTAADHDVLIEFGAGEEARFPDSAYQQASASLATRSEIIDQCDVLAVVHAPGADTIALLRAGQFLIGLLDPLNDPVLVAALTQTGVTAAAFELLPRTLSRAQSMDALSSQASAAGYKAAVVAADSFGRYLPMMITASGTARPANLIVIGTGVAGLQAIATSRRLGAVVTGYDVRPASRGEVESLGARFLTSSIAEGAAAGGYARALSPEEHELQQTELARELVTFDIIITTAKVPGRTPPLLVSAETLTALKPGSVCVDLAASDLGGNVSGSVDRKTVVTAGGVSIIGAGDLAAELPTSASAMYARNIHALLESFTTDNQLQVDLTNDIHTAVLICHNGEVVNAQLHARRLEESLNA